MALPEYSRRMNRVIDHIDANLSMPLDLDALADVAHFSRFHFHRVFAAWFSETLGSYLRRRRLESAAIRLSGDCRIPVGELALDVGFGSGEAFARAFKDHFGLTPTAWRCQAPVRRAAALAAIKVRRQQQRNVDQVDRNSDQALSGGRGHDEDSNQPNSELIMQVSIVSLPAVRIAYLRYIGPYGEPVGAFWRNVFAPWASAHQLSDQCHYGIGHDDPSVTPAAKCRYDACSEIPSDFAVREPAGIMLLPGGRYAIAQFAGTSDMIGDAWTELFGAWLPSSGYVCDARPCFERYPVAAPYDADTGHFECALCIPVRPL